jgi:hypothetical protein
MGFYGGFQDFLMVSLLDLVDLYFLLSTSKENTNQFHVSSISSTFNRGTSSLSHNLIKHLTFHAMRLPKSRINPGRGRWDTRSFLGTIILLFYFLVDNCNGWEPRVFL